VFSFKTTANGKYQGAQEGGKKGTGGTGANNLITRTQIALEKQGVRVHMKNEDCPENVGASQATFDSWKEEWKMCASACTLVVCFTEPSYATSKPCQEEMAHAKSQCSDFLELPYRGADGKPLPGVTTVSLTKDIMEFYRDL
jgi:hypothetical protein